MFSPRLFIVRDGVGHWVFAESEDQVYDLVDEKYQREIGDERKEILEYMTIEKMDDMIHLPMCCQMVQKSL